MLRVSLVLGLIFAITASAFVVVSPAKTRTASSSALFSSTTEKGYTPQWKKKDTIGGEGLDDKSKGLIGNVPVVFKQGNITLSTMALVGQPLSDVASQAGQYIKYGCKKGECGTCECMVDGKWLRPCVATVPPVAQGQELTVTLKSMTAKATSSGKFYSVKSFFMGFYNNLLGMVGFVKMRRRAKENWNERIEYEDLIEKRTAEKRMARAAAESNLKP